MKHILFVDDEPSILDGIRRLLRPWRHEWDIHFATSGEDACAIAEQQRLEAIVADMRMPGMDGAAVLRQFEKRWPGTVRLILSGYAEAEATLRAVPVAHQFLSKPSTGERIVEVVGRALALRDLLADDRMQSVVGAIGELPARPATYTAIVEALSDPDVEMGHVTAILRNDVATAAKVLQLVNSAFFGLPQETTNVERAISYLGFNMIRDLVLSTEVFEPPAGLAANLIDFLERLQAHSLLCGQIASRMFGDKSEADRAYAAGLLHNVGLIVLATRKPEQFTKIRNKAREIGEPLRAVEADILGCTHAEVGAYLLGLWGLPYPIIETAAYHHNPLDLPHQTVSELTVVHVANALIEKSRAGTVGAVENGAHIDLDYLERLGVSDRLEEWEQIAQEQVVGPDESA